MDRNTFFIEFDYKDNLELAEVKPCCQENNVFYYDIMIKNQYQFTITPSWNDELGMEWKVSLKNADKQVDPQLIEIIGAEIEKNMV
jgi:hypothetical protein